MGEPSADRRNVLALCVIAAVLAGVSQASATAPAVAGHSRAVELSAEPGDLRVVGDRLLWQREVLVEGATFVKPHFTDLNLRAGDRLLVRSGSGRLVEEITGRGPGGLGSFWGLSVPGESLLLELEVGRRSEGPPFRIDQVIVGELDLGEASSREVESVCPPADFEDAICHQDDHVLWSNGAATVGVMSVGGSPGGTGMEGLWCTGSVVSPDGHVLTSYDCLPLTGDCANVEFVLGYHRTGCGGDALPATDWQSFRCQDVLVSSPFLGCEPQAGSLDFTLASAVGNPATEYGFVRPEPDPVVSGEDLYILQYPAGRPLEVTSGGGADVVVEGMTLRYFGTLDTDAGSQGAPIFRETDGRMVGLHHCGGCTTPGDGNRGVLMADIHPLIQGYLCTNSLLLRWDGFDDLSEVDGDGDAVIEPGETWQLTPLVVNLSCSQGATDASITMTPAGSTSGPVYMVAATVPLGDIAAGETAAASEPVVFQLDPGAPCGGSVILDVATIQAWGGGPFPGTAPAASFEIGEIVTTALLGADFGAGMPAGWSVEHLGSGSGPAASWSTDNPGGRTLPLTEPFAICDSGALGPGETMDERLVTGAVDCASSGEVDLVFRHDFNWAGASLDETGDVDVRSAATGGQWVTVASFSGEDSSGGVEVDISAQAAGQAAVEVSFHYYDASYEWWWAVDDVSVLDRTLECQAHQPLPVAAFSVPLQVCDGSEVQPVDGSRFADTWAWDYEDDGEVDAAGPSPPPVVYPGPARYTCQLEVENVRGSAESRREVNVIPSASAVTGDANGDGAADAADVAAVIAELHDGDPQAVASACQGFATTDRSDADGDTFVTADDLTALAAGLY